jgi:putative cell wall-binding protein
MYKKSVIAILVFALLFITGSSIPIEGISEPAFAAGSSQDFTRLGGKDRFETNAAIVDNGWQHADTIVVVRGTGKDKFADAMASTILAYQYDAPILLVDQNTIPQPIKDTITKLQPSKAFIIGGPTVVSDGIEQTLKNDDIVVERIYGQDRRETAIKIGDKMRGKTAFDTVIIATGRDFPDALSAAPFSAMYNIPILFVTNKPTEFFLDELNKKALIDWGIKKAIIVGGPSVVSTTIEDDIKYVGTNGLETIRLSGLTRYETSLEIVKHFDKGDYQGITVATGKDFADLLAGAVFAAKNKTPIILADDKQNLYDTVEYLIGNNFTKRYVLGGEGIMPITLLDKLFSGSNSMPEPEKPTFEESISIAAASNFVEDGQDRLLVTLRWLDLPNAVAYNTLLSYDDLTIEDSNPYIQKIVVKKNSDGTVDGGSIIDGYFYRVPIAFYRGYVMWVKIEAVDSNGNVLDSGIIKVDAR